MNIKKIVVIVICVLLWSCEQEIDSGIPLSTKNIVLNGFMRAGELLTVNISKSVYILSRETEPVFLSNAEVVLHENGIAFDSLKSKGSGRYISSRRLYPGNNYTIKVSANDFQSVTSKSYIPDIPDIIKIDTLLDFAKSNISANITLKDPINIENYYLINVFAYHTTEKRGVAEEKVQLPIKNKSDDVFDDEIVESGILLRDQYFEGNTKNIPIEIDVVGLLSSNSNNFSLEINLHAITKELYLYLKSKEQQKYTVNNPFVDGIKVISNVDNGLGIFSGLNTASQTFEIRQK